MIYLIQDEWFYSLLQLQHYLDYMCPLILYFAGTFSSSFTSNSQAPSNFSNRSIAHALKARRPLISPAKFSFSEQQRFSTPTKFQGKFRCRKITRTIKFTKFMDKFMYIYLKIYSN